MAYIFVAPNMPPPHLFFWKLPDQDLGAVDWQVMEALPQLMFKADAVIHIIGTPTKLMMGEGVPWRKSMIELKDEDHPDVCC